MASIRTARSLLKRSECIENIDLIKEAEDFVKKTLKKVNKKDFVGKDYYEDELSRQIHLYVAKRKFNISLVITILFTFYEHLKTTVSIYLYESIITLIIYMRTKDKNLSSMLLQLFNNEYDIDQLEKENELLRAQLTEYAKATN